MTTKNDITGDKLVTKTSSDAYRSGWDNIFKKKEEHNDFDKLTEELDNSMTQEEKDEVGAWVESVVSGSKK